MRMAFAGAALLALAACGDNGTLTIDDEAEADAVVNAAQPGAPAGLTEPAERVTASNGQQYVDLVAAIDRYEIESARLALEKSQDRRVRAFAQMLLRDHGRSTQRLSAAAGGAEPRLRMRPELSRAQRADIAALRGARAEDFDRTYLDQQMRAHETALGLVTDYASVGDVEPLRLHASQVSAPILQHLSQARSLSEGSVAEQLEQADDSAAVPPGNGAR